MLANVNLSHDTKLLANNGRVIVIGSRGEVTINPRELMGRRASIRGFTLWGITPTEEADIHAGIFAGLENGTLRPVIGKELPLARLAGRLAGRWEQVKAGDGAVVLIGGEPGNREIAPRAAAHRVAEARRIVGSSVV